MTDRPLLELQNVSLVYRALPALRDIDWSVHTGEQWACLGPNGAGKTSLARVLSRQVTRFSGEMRSSRELECGGVAYVCFEQARALCARDRTRMGSASFFRPTHAFPARPVPLQRSSQALAAPPATVSGSL